MPLRSHRSVSFQEPKYKDTEANDSCVLSSYKKLPESPQLYRGVNKVALPRSKSDPSRGLVTKTAIQLPSLSENVNASSSVRFSPAPYHTVPLSRHPIKPKPPSKSKRVKALGKNTLATISSPQPLDLYGIPNGLLDIDAAPTADQPILLRRQKNDSPVSSDEKAKRNRRRGIILEQDSVESTNSVSIEISDPVLISHDPKEAIENNVIDLSQLKLRTREEQDIVSKKFSSNENLASLSPATSLTDLLSIESNGKSKHKTKQEKVKKPKPKAIQQLKDSEPSGRTSSSGRMADKIQRTIKALYDGNLPRRQSVEKLADEEELIEDKELLKVIEASPKTEKRTGRKSRSPKTIRRAQVPIKDVDGSRRFKWRGSVNRIVRKFGQGQTLMQGQTFDVHLEDCPPSPNNECVPYVVELCCRVVEERGLNFTGIYRVPGNSGTLAALQDELNTKGPDNIDLDTDERFLELNVISSLLKSFFRKLPDPLFTNELYDDFITMNRKKDSEERLNGLRRLIHMLPAPHYETLKFLVAHLKRVADNAEVNKMEVRNLAIVFGPTLVRSTVSDNMATMVTDMSDQCRIVESVLQHAAWFFVEGKDEAAAELAPLPPPPAEEHQPVPNIDHLLANVGRTPGDESDSTESSKSKNSLASEKESFSRDVMDMILGVRKRWLNQQTGGTRKDGASESDDEYGFKEAERRQARAAVEKKFKSEDLTENNATPQPSSYQVAKAAASELRAVRASQDQHLPHDIQSRLYDFYVEHLERLARTEVSRPPPQFTSSSETSPQVTPRHSNIYAPPPPQIQRPLRRSSDSNDPRAPKDVPKRQWSSPPSSPPRNLRHIPPAHGGPVLYGESPLNRRYNKHPQAAGYRGALATSTPMHGEAPTRTGAPKCGNLSELSSISKEDVRVVAAAGHTSESDSDTSIYVGDTLEEKLKNLTNLDKKLERRPSRRYARPEVAEAAWGVPARGKRPIAIEPLAGGGKKSSRELYQERRAMRQQHREQAKASRGTAKSARRQTNGALTRCASDENVFQRCDPKRQHVRSPNTIEEKQRRRPSTDRVRRRHTLGGNDFPGQEFWEKEKQRKEGQDQVYGSLQNVSATSRLKPRGAPPAPGAERPPGHWQVDFTSLRTKHRQNTKKSESYI